ncbi:MAG: DUF6789 family protein [Bryobacteraceae bacterium]
MHIPIWRTLIGGFLSTILLTVLAFSGPVLNLPQLDYPSMFGAAFTGEFATPLGGAWWVGLISHFILGAIVFPLIFTQFLYSYFPGAPWARGLSWGLALWLLSQVVLMPIMELGLFFSMTSKPLSYALAGFIGHAVYGIVLGAVAGAGEVSGAPVRRERHA